MSERDLIDFADLARALLDRAEILVPQWLPGGTIKGHEYVCADLGGGAGGSFSVNLRTGAWADFSNDDDRGGDLTGLYAAIHGINMGQAARRLQAELGWQRSSPAASTPRLPSGERPEPPLEDVDAPAAGPRKSMWRAIAPVPPHAPPADFKHWHYTEKVASWEYSFEGQLYGHVVRFATSDGGKEILPHTWCVDESDARGTQRWHWKQWDEPRPLYVPATLLSGTPRDVPVVLVEGEKCAMAGFKLLGHEFDFVSWPGGSNAWAKANWGWLLGRTVYLWPDADAKRQRLSPQERKDGVDPDTKPLLDECRQPGMKAMVAIGSLLLADQACTVLMCPVPKPDKVATDGWDIADAIEGGWTAEDLRAFIRGAHVFVAPDAAANAKASAERSTPTSAGAGNGEDDEALYAWRKSLLQTAKGATLAVRENVVMALDGWPERGIAGIAEAAGLIAFNEFTNNVEKTRPTPWGSPAGSWLEADELQMGDWLVREHWLPSMARSTLEEAVLVVAHRHSFHPVRERFETLRGQWDQVPRLATWLRRTCLQEDEYDDKDPLQRYLARAGTWFIMAMCCRVLPEVKEGARTVRGAGTKFDYMLILEGPQGWGKSTLGAVLGGDYFADTGLMIGDKDSYQNIQGVLVYEWGELENLTRSEVGKVKLFISSPKDRFRASFDRRPRDYPRQVVFFGSTNERNYLTDVTGNRRFWPVQVTRPPDVAWLRENLDQMIAEALHRLDAGERFWPNLQEQRLLFDPQQQSRTVESSIESGIRQFLYDETQTVPHGGENGTLVQEIGLTALLTRIGYSMDKQTDVVVKKAGSVMHSLGWAVKRTSQEGRPRVYRRPTRTEELARASDGSMAGRDAGPQPAGATDDCPF